MGRNWRGPIPSIFISYRRTDTGGYAGRLADALIHQFGRANVFIDIDTISPGADFEQKIREALDTCELALVLIGPTWLTVEAPGGTRRIDADDDLVKQEVAAALGRSDVTVVPVLVEGATMPAAAELPPEIVPLAKFNAFDLTNKRWNYDVAQLAQLARRHDKWWWRLILRTPRLALRVAPVIALAVAGVVVVAVANSGPDKATRIASCEGTHRLAAAQVSRPPRSGETQFQKSDVTPPYGSSSTFKQTTYASCSWPPAPGADADGYGAITVTLTNGPGVGDASNRDFADVIESRCKNVRLHYAYEHMGDQIPYAAFVANRGGIWAPAPTRPRYSFTHVTEIGSSAQAPLRLPFYPPARATVVLHGQELLQRAACVD